MPHTAQRPAIDAKVNSFLASRGLSAINRPTPKRDLEWKEQRHTDLTELSSRRRLSQDEMEELDQLGSELNEAAGIASWDECERRGL